MRELVNIASCFKPRSATRKTTHASSEFLYQDDPSEFSKFRACSLASHIAICLCLYSLRMLTIVVYRCAPNPHIVLQRVRACLEVHKIGEHARDI